MSERNTLRLQRALAAEGFSPGKIDGDMGPKTEAALSSWRVAAASWVRGIDVSRWQTSIDWDSVRLDNVRFAYLKATDGLGTDPLFSKHLQGARKAGILVGAYHFFRPNRDPLVQAQRFCTIAAGLDLPLALDVERDDDGADKIPNTADDIKATSAAVLVCLKEIERLTKKRPLVYSYGPFLDSHNIELGEYPLWIADYRSGPPTIPPGWASYKIHQHEGDGGVQAGVTGPCDLNRFRGTIEELGALAG